MTTTQQITFENNALLLQLLGEHDKNLDIIEDALEVQIATRGNQIQVSGKPAAVSAAAAGLHSLYQRLSSGQSVTAGDVAAAVRLAQAGALPDDGEIAGIRTRKRLINPRTKTQKDYLEALSRDQLVFGLGPAGTGKTYLAVAKAVEYMLAGKISRLILSRPAVEAGEHLGFLPGDLRSKVDPYLRPLYDALHDMLPAEEVEKRLANGEIEVAPLAFMRGRTLSNAFVILDEAQNTTHVQMKMFLTRLGEGSRMAITGDLSQVDLPKSVRSGLREAIAVLDGVAGVSFVRFQDEDVVRHPLVARIVKAYDHFERRQGNPYEMEG
ncbi:MAG: PhoH family protein [Holosporales bacterium]